MTGFVHLRVHTEYSLVDSVVRVPELIEAVAAVGMPAVALTDSQNLFALVKFYGVALKRGVKPVVGVDLLIAEPGERSEPCTLTLLCVDEPGYRNITRLVSRAYIEGQQRGRALVDRAWLTPASLTGLIGLSGGAGGDVARAALAGREDEAGRLLDQWAQWLPGRFYLEISRVGRPDEERWIDWALDRAAPRGLPLVATNDVRFLTAAEFETHEARVCIHDGALLADPSRPRRYTAQQFLRSADEMAALFADIPEALENSVEIARRCSMPLRLGEPRLPQFPLPDGASAEDFLAAEARRGLVARMAGRAGLDPTLYADRLERELGVICTMGFAGYFLIVADFIRWARSNGVPVGPGRGSGAGSLVAYALQITDIDPLQFDLLFERFLNPERVSMPDFDVDFCMEGRDRVIDYVADRYGRDRVSQIITYGTMAAKAVVRDVGRVLGLPYGYVDRIAKLVPFELDITLDAALVKEPELRKLYDNDDEVHNLIDLARSLEGLTRNAGKHAGGVVIAPSVLTDFAPLYCEEGAQSVVTQFDKDDVEAAGLVKFDFLGLRTLTIIERAVRRIDALRAARGEPRLDMAALPMDDPATFALLKRCATTAVFQLESRGMKDLIRRLVPDSFAEIVALVALFRPGPLESGMVGDYIERKHGRSRVIYPHPKLEPILNATYGVILYQEQVMQIARDLAGYSLGSADLLRRAMGKKDKDEMAQQRLVFVKGAIGRGVEENRANIIFDQMETFGGYGFNKSHSAAYALLAYQTAWLKKHYQAEYMAAVLSADMDNTDKLDDFVHDCRALKIELLPPDINLSNYMFTAQAPSTIRYGLGAIKGLGRSAIELIEHERNIHGPFLHLADFCNRMDLQKVNRRAMDVCIRAGAMDVLDPDRNCARLMHELNDALQAAEQLQQDRAAGQVDMFGQAETATAAAPREHKVIPPWTAVQSLQGEHDALGLYLTSHPTQIHEAELARFSSCRLDQLGSRIHPGDSPNHRRNGVAMTLSGLVRSIRRRGGNRSSFVTIEDMSSQLEISVSDEIWALFADQLIKDEIIVVEGNVSVDNFLGGYRMTAQKIRSLAQARAEYARGVQISLRSCDNMACEALEAAFLPYRKGRATVFIDYSNNRARARLELSAAWNLEPCEELLAALSGLDEISDARLIY